MTINVELMRQVADRIDPKTRLPGTARYNQRVYGRLRHKYVHEYSDFPYEDIPECGTTGCIAGHVYIVTHGLEAWQKYLMDEEEPTIGLEGRRALGLTDWQGKVLFSVAISSMNVEACFGIAVDWNGLPSAKQVAKLLRRIADKYEAEQLSALEIGGQA